METRGSFILPLSIALALFSLNIGLAGCPPAGDDDDVSADDDDSAADDDDTTAGDDDDSTSMPADPSPFTLTLSGGENESIPFDASECVLYPSPSDINFRTTWRGTSHNAVLIAEVMGTFAGAGSYTIDGAQTRVKLQSEAGSPYNFFYQVDVSQEDSGTMDVVHVDGEAGVAWGEFTFSGMHGGNGALTVSPLPIPLWCDDVQN
jgi:hypothetical protein